MSKMEKLKELSGDDFYAKLRKKYGEERDRRIRQDGMSQYVSVSGKYARYVDHDPNVKHEVKREPLTDEIEILIIGGGWAGLLAAARLSEQDVHEIRIVDDAGDFGGAWYWNQYPGAQCDVESYSYLPLLEETGYMPKQNYSNGPEIKHYATVIAEHYGLYDKAVFHTRVTETRWNESLQRWIVKTNRGDEMKARFVILAPGLTSRAKLPGIPGLDEFESHAFHTSRWDYDYTGGSYDAPMDKLADKTVGIIGTGCTAIQCIPPLAESAKHLYVFQRTPSAVDVRNTKQTDPDWYRSQEPGWQRRRRRNFDDLINKRPHREDLVQDGWTEIARKLQAGEYPTGPIDLGGDLMEVFQAAELADFHKMQAIRDRVDNVVQDAETAEKLKAWYPQLCKRPVFNDSYLETFNRPNVTLVDTADCHGVERLTKHGVVANGVEYPVDCLVFSTGYEQASSYDKRFAIEVFGRDGQSLYDYWSEGMRTLYGHSINGFPNWFFIGHSQVGVTFNFVAIVDAVAQQVSWVIAETKRRGAKVVEATKEGEAAWVAEVKDKAIKDWSFQDSCTPGYYNAEGQKREAGDSNHSFWDDWYYGGLFHYIELLEAWRADGRMDGLQLK